MEASVLWRLRRVAKNICDMGRIFLLGAVIVFGVHCVSAQVPDSTFGELYSFDDFNGLIRVAVTGVNFDGRNDRCYASFHLSDGRILLAGHTSGSDGTDMAMARLLANGRYDESAGPGGRMRIDLGHPADSILCAAMDAQERIVAAGAARTQGSNRYVNIVARTNADGIPDSTFGGNGHLLVDLPSDHELITQVIAMPDGRILLAGEARYGDIFWFPDSVYVFLLRLMPDGAPDASFGQNGLLLFSTENACRASVVSDMAIDHSGRIVVAGNSFHPTPDRKEGVGSACSFEVRIHRFLTDGSPDMEFGSDGWAKVLPRTPSSTIGGLVRTIQILEDDKILLAGNADPFSFFSERPAMVFLAKMQANGAPDSTFGGNGRFMRFIVGAADLAVPLSVLPLGESLYVGFEDYDASFSFAFGLFRFSTSGDWDTVSFGTNGVFNTDQIGWLPFYGKHHTHLSATDTNSIFIAGTYITFSLNMMIAKVKLNNPIISSANENTGESRVRIFPNPVSDGVLNVEYSGFASEGLVHLRMSDMQGRLLWQRQEWASGGIGQADVSQLPPGMYVLEVGNGAHWAVRRVVVGR